MSTLRKRLQSVEERIVLQEHRDLERLFQGRSKDEQLFFIVHGYWPENGGDTLPPRVEFTVRGIKTIVSHSMGRRESEGISTEPCVESQSRMPAAGEGQNFSCDVISKTTPQPKLQFDPVLPLSAVP